jgi:hypothetical protein
MDKKRTLRAGKCSKIKINLVCMLSIPSSPGTVPATILLTLDDFHIIRGV